MSSSAAHGHDESIGSHLTQLPEEIIENIAECLRYPIHPQLEATERFLSEGATRFSTTRFYLSTFSKVSKQVRYIVERYLYRDIHVDLGGWARSSQIMRKHPMFPAGSLALLLGTLDERPELHRFIRTVAIHCTVSEVVIPEAFTFLRECAGLHSLWVSPLPEWVLACLATMNLQISSFAAFVPAPMVHRVVAAFPRLKNTYLYIEVNNSGPIELSMPQHGITTMVLKFYADLSRHASLLPLAMVLPQRAENVYLEAQDTNLENPDQPVVPSFPRLTSGLLPSVEHLTLKNINPFDPVTVNGIAYYGLTELAALRHLHLMRCPPLVPAALTQLPMGLRSLTFSDYGLDSKVSAERSKTQFVQSVVDSLRLGSSERKLAGIKTYGAVPDDPWELGNLAPLQAVCQMERLPFVQIGSFADIEPQLILFFSGGRTIEPRT
ncbi:hypothetical protein C8F01DRAFT_1153687 [Mycena amicta]|nr:hypothetical protein C8F01DRAFT_1153687 [Mycena amicta]